jgi:hypothetical protein
MDQENLIMDDQGRYLISGSAGDYSDVLISMFPNGTLNWVKSFGGLGSDLGLDDISLTIDGGVLCGRCILVDRKSDPCLHSQGHKVISSRWISMAILVEIMTQ